MENKIKGWKSNRNVLKLMQCRELNSTAAKVLKQRTQFSANFIQRLGLEAELEGHQGCVNCLEWSPNGLHLASGSDDTNVILWDPFRHKQINVIPTPHIGNIFSVKFLADENVIATAAGDCRVVVQSVSGALDKSAPLLDCACHIGRVKRLATAPDQPTLFWSAGEDGLVVQYDLREPHECPTQSKVLVDLSFKSEIKCIAVNPTKSHYIAIGANDCFVRLYDRRMIKVSMANLSFNPSKRTSPQPQNSDCVQYYAPGHLARENAGIMSIKLSVTYIAFNSAGSEMLVNIGGEQIYLFDVNNSRHINELKIPQNLPKRPHQPYRNCCQPNVLLAELNGVSADLFEKNTDCACFYMRRALQAYQRKWMGDLYAAARDYLHVIQHWPDHKQAYIGLIKCLIAMKWEDEANAWLKHFTKLYPECETSSQVKFLVEELQALKNSVKFEETGVKKVEDDEKKLRLDSFDFEKIYIGHCNTTTDIKEANFLGDCDNYICAGSDEGIIFIWDKKSMNVVRALFGDNSIVNCIQPHPSACVIASSGIDTAVKIWSPRPEDGKVNNRIVKCISTVVETNQHRMSMDPFESMLASMGYQIEGSALDGSSIQEVPTCRTS
ncbi:WD and tetratricopeptide repeats protein 1 isoform X1 [Tribolium castaneum]|nr:PREDICTED: WD and tetratricopeptide repeats protein 1 [Tribolium castaneum]|eukprot:XP_970829.1 PREDICTED: WD and tetratricopeptide repeats protein 1 [Tribolium castaneum]